MSDDNTLLSAEPESVETPEGEATNQESTQAAPESETKPETPAENTEQENQESETPATEVPEKYEFKAPDGVEYDADTIKVYEDAAREAGLSQEKASLILDKIAPHLAQRQQQALESARNQWAEESKSDPEFGGQKFQENLAIANKALKQFGSPELTELLNKTGLGNHKEMIRLLSRVGSAISEDGFVQSGKAAGGESDARSLFPNTKLNP